MTEELKPLPVCPFCCATPLYYDAMVGAEHQRWCPLYQKDIDVDIWKHRPLESALEAQVESLTDVADEDLIRLSELREQNADLLSRLKEVVGDMNRYIENNKKYEKEKGQLDGLGNGLMWSVMKYALDLLRAAFPELEGRKK
jgi:hypothetical protein